MLKRINAEKKRKEKKMILLWNWLSGFKCDRFMVKATLSIDKIRYILEEVTLRN